MRRHSLSPLLLALSLALGTSMTAHAQSQPAVAVAADGTLLNISANAEARRVPDVATLSAGVVTQAVDGNTAMRQNAEQMVKVLAAIKAAGIAERDVQTSGVNLSPQYRYADNEAPKITGYQASNTVSLKVRDIAKLGKVLDALAAQGANQINGPQFEIDQPEPVYDEARLAALKKAQARAETYSKSLGLRVRRIVSISESGGGNFRPVMMRAAAAPMAADVATPVSPGESTVSVNLDVVFDLGR
ncbi:SIMPL domain-containing protein [Stenotrophomonas sp. NPDC077421]|uniref:SIMPL domain-containing protein n=1 Tax=Stenotrophomonas sp. NPDC077421 TaxID=3414699 RepID=UPI003C2FB35B